MEFKRFSNLNCSLQRKILFNINIEKIADEIVIRIKDKEIVINNYIPYNINGKDIIFVIEEDGEDLYVKLREEKIDDTLIVYLKPIDEEYQLYKDYPCAIEYTRIYKGEIVGYKIVKKEGIVQHSYIVYDNYAKCKICGHIENIEKIEYKKIDNKKHYTKYYLSDGSIITEERSHDHNCINDCFKDELSELEDYLKDIKDTGCSLEHPKFEIYYNSITTEDFRFNDYEDRYELNKYIKYRTFKKGDYQRVFELSKLLIKYLPYDYKYYKIVKIISSEFP